MKYIEVILPLPLQGYFSYGVNDSLYHEELVGCRVTVPFGKRKIYTGVVARVLENEPSYISIKEVIEVLDERPILNAIQLGFLEWVSRYYMCSVGEVYNAATPTNLKLTSESYVSKVKDIDYDETTLSNHEFDVLEFLESTERTQEEIKQILGLKNIYRIIKSLQDQGLIYLYEKVKDKYSPKKEKRIRLNPSYLGENALQELSESLESKPKQLDVLLTYLKQVDLFNSPELNDQGMLFSGLKNEGLSPSSMNTLVKNSVFETWEKTVDRFAFDDEKAAEIPILTPDQEIAYNSILSEFEDHSTVLLQGVTGSGKTEIYIRLIKEQIDTGNQVLYLLPEIALTTQIIKRFRKVFGNRFGIYHSRESDNERAEVFKKCSEGKFDFVIGVRSSVFLPFQYLSLIIVDEEHESSYKQYDPAPRYHARDAAIVLSNMHDAKTLIGSATPSLESYHNAQSGKYGWVRLDKRYEDQPMPEIILADLKKERKQRTMKGHTSGQLLELIQQSIEKEKQVILFQNRRGYAPFLQCDNCQHIPKCVNCDVSLTYHIYQNELVCHYCGFRQFYDASCPSCGSHQVRTVGSGTEMLEEELTTLLPDTQMKRMDLDTTRHKYAYQQIIDDFENGSIQVLIGTQMVSKGLDFEHVNLVGVYDADRMIHFPDFRSHERSYQMISQVSGRSGRKHEKGKVIIQVSDPEHPVIKWIQSQDLEGFYAYELNQRSEHRFPPFYRLIKTVIRDRDKSTSLQAAQQLHLLMKKDLGERVHTPVEPLIGKIRNYYLHEIHVRVEKNHGNLQPIKEFMIACRETLLALPAFKSVMVHFDVDPL